VYWYTVVMRKYFLGIVIAVIFLAYSTILRHQHSEPIVAPASLDQNNTTAPTATAPSATTPSSPVSQYKDGTYTGSVDNAFYGNVQVAAIIQNGKLITVNFLQYPDENPNSVYVNTSAIPYLKQEAIKAQSSTVSIVTGATFTSQAFRQSLSNALSQATQG
jgi:uncharacterized protein with FMN-binding domain